MTGSVLLSLSVLLATPIKRIDSWVYNFKNYNEYFGKIKSQKLHTCEVIREVH